MNMRKGAAWLIGTSTVLTVVALPFGPGLATQVMSGDFSVLSAIKWSTIVAGTFFGLFFLVRHGIFANENLEEGERGYRRRWGKIVAKRKTGKRTLLLPGKKHFYVKHWFDVVVQSVRKRSTPEEPDFGNPTKATFNDKNIWYLLVIDWRVEDDEEAIYKSLTQVYQVKRAQEGNDALENYVYNQVLKTVRRHLKEFDSDSDDLPIFTLDPDVASVPEALLTLVEELHNTLGVLVENIDPVLLTLAPEEGFSRLKA